MPPEETLSRNLPNPASVEPITVVVCTYRGTAYLTEQLESIRAQTVPPAEIIVSDDASGDGTVELARRVLEAPGLAQIPYRLIVNTPGRGTAENFRHAVLAARTDLVALSDQDDVWHPDRLERSLGRHAAQPELDLLFGDARLVDATRRDLGFTLFASLEFGRHEREQISSGRAFDTFLRRNLATGATVTVRRRLVDWAGPIGEDWIHDEWWAVLAAARDAIGFSTDTLIDYRQHGANQIGVQQPSLGGKIRRVLARDELRNARLARRSAALSAFLEQADTSTLEDASARIAAARGKARIESFRAGLPRLRLRRIIPVLREARRGDYERFTSQGRAEILRDLLQPR